MNFEVIDIVMEYWVECLLLLFKHLAFHLGQSLTKKETILVKQNFRINKLTEGT